MASHGDVDAKIVETLRRSDLSGEDILALTIARRLNGLSDSLFAQAVGGAGVVGSQSRGSVLERLLS